MSLPGADPDGTGTFVKRTLIASALVILLVLSMAFIWYSTGLLLVIFSAVLFALFLRGVSDWVEKRIKLPAVTLLLVVVGLLFGLFALFGWFFYPRVSLEVEQLREALPASLQMAQDQMGRHAWGRWLLGELQNAAHDIRWRDLLYSKTVGVFSSTVGVLAGLAFAVVLGFYIALEYRDLIEGSVTILPAQARPRLRKVLHAIGGALQLWLISRFLAMLQVTVLIGMGLYFLRIPMALSLAMLTGMLTFVPNFGPVAAIIPVLMLALLQGPAKFFYVIILYAAVYSLEGNVTTPLIQREMLHIPISILLTGQVLLGALFGGVGVAVAMPLTVASAVLAKEMWKDTLEAGGSA